FADNSEQFWLSEIRSEVLLCTVQKNPLMQAVQDFFSALMGQEPSKEPLYSVQFQARYLFEPDQLEDAKAQMKEQMEQAYAQLSPGMSEFDREAALHDWLMTRCSYSDEAAAQILENGEELDRFLAESTAYGAVVRGEAVCTGYADAMKLLLGGAGVRCALQQGKAPGPDGDGELAGHVWNIVTIDGEPYHLDPTWDDLGDWTFDGQDSPVLLKEMQGAPENPAEIYRGYTHLYFNVTDDEISRSHAMDEPPGCTALNGQYYRQKGLWFTRVEGPEKAALTGEIVRAVRRGTCMVEIDLSGAEDPQALIDRLTDEEDGVIFSCIAGANNQLEEARLREDYVVYQPGPAGQLIFYFMKERG
ncbi:MAG: hypothetical protein HFE85_00895, partial [Clostridiales bacterium]|nr:hypothetical protein [Clostridiales bacterium]